MTVKLSLALTINKSDFEILKVVDKNCLLIADIKVVDGNMILLEIEAFNSLTSKIY